MIPAMIECAATMIERWKLFEGRELDVLKELKVYTLDVISHTAFGSSYEQGKNVFQMLQELSDLSIRNEYKIRIPVIRYLVKNHDLPQWYDIVHFEHKLSWLCFSFSRCRTPLLRPMEPSNSLPLVEA